MHAAIRAFSEVAVRLIAGHHVAVQALNLARAPSARRRVLVVRGVHESPAVMRAVQVSRRDAFAGCAALLVASAGAQRRERRRVAYAPGSALGRGQEALRSVRLVRQCRFSSPCPFLEEPGGRYRRLHRRRQRRLQPMRHVRRRRETGAQGNERRVGCGGVPSMP